MILECMICGRRSSVLREGKLCLCSRCIAALGEALGEKLGYENDPEEDGNA